MPQVDFYILQQHAAATAGELFVCKLVDKAFRLKHNIYIHTQTQQQATTMDDLLWTFNPGSFLPHSLYGPDCNSATPICIGFENQDLTFHDVLINLHDEVPSFFGQFDRVAEIVCGDAAARNQARLRYKYYRDRGYALNTHELSA